MKIQNPYGLIEEYLDQGDYFAPLVVEGTGDITVIDQYGRLRAYAEYGDGYAEVVSTDDEADFKRVINQYWIIERLAEIEEGIYGRFVTTDPGEDPKSVIDPHGLRMLYANMGDGTHALVVGGFGNDTAVINKYGVRVGYSVDDGVVLPGFGLAIINDGITPITELSESGDAVTTHSVANLGELTVASWALTEGDDVFSIDSSGNVTLDDLTGVSTDQTYTVQATLSDDPATVLTLTVTVPWHELTYQAIRMGAGKALRMGAGKAIQMRYL